MDAKQEALEPKRKPNRATFSQPVTVPPAPVAPQSDAERDAETEAFLGNGPVKPLRDVWGEKMLAQYGKHAASIEFARATGYKNWKAATDDQLDDATIAKMLEDYIATHPATADVPKEQPAEKAATSPVVEQPAMVEPEPTNEPVSTPQPAISALSKIKTLTGVSAADISKRMNGRFPAPAYEPIPYGPMKGKTDLSFDYVRDRFDEVFGPHGLGWKLEPHAVLGKVEHIEVDEPKRDGGTRHVHMVAMEMFVFKYRVELPDGTLEWIESSPLSDCDDNEDRGYAYRGAWTSLLKQTLRSFGGINHILRNEYTHVQAQQGRRAA